MEAIALSDRKSGKNIGGLMAKDLTPGNRRSSLSPLSERFGMAPLTDRIERMMEGLMRGWMTADQDESVFMPRFDLVEDEEKFEFSVELPGLEAKDVEISFKDNGLLIKGERRAEKKENAQTSHYIERSYGLFERFVPIRAEIDQDRIHASFKNGVLHITVPKSEQAKSKVKKISIEDESTNDSAQIKMK
jgi:HSP20 family protein